MLVWKTLKRTIIINECSELDPKEYKTRHDWFGNEIHWELCKKSKFDNTNKNYMQNPESVLENEMQNILCDCEMQTDHLISTRRPHLVIVKKKKKKKKDDLLNSKLCLPGRRQSKNKRKWKER